MPELLDVLLLFGIGLVSGVINVMAGGGSSLTLPALIFLGLDAPTANGTNRVAILVQTFVTVLSFRRENIRGLRRSVVFGLCTLPGAVAGAVVAVNISDEAFEIILGVIMIGVVVSMLLPRKVRTTTAEGVSSWWIYPALVGIGFYGGFMQVGVGFLIMAALYHLLRMDLVFVNMHKAAIVLIYTVPALAIFAWLGYVDWLLGLSLAAGNAVSGWWGARVAVRGGERVVRIVLIIAVLIMAMKLLNVF